MEALDSSIANVAMPHIGGSLSASRDEATWVLTSYLVANAMVLPISGWIANRMGRKRFYMTCVFLFTIASLLCGLAPTLGMLVFFRVLQGAAGGGLQPSEQSILADTFPPEKRSMAFAVYGMAVVLAPVLGPTVGGWIVDNYSWRWIFFINIPVGILSLYLTNRLVEDPPYLAAIRKRREGVDYWGLGLLVVSIGALQIMLDKGQEDDWFSSRFIVTCSVIAAIGLAIFIVAPTPRRAPHPRPAPVCAAQRRHDPCSSCSWWASRSTPRTVLIPQFLQEIMGYSAEQAGMAVSSGGLALMVLFPVAGALAPKFDPRWLVAMGFIITTFGLWRMTGLNLNVSFGMAVSWRVVIALGLPFLFIPINTLCYVGHSAGEVQRGQRHVRADAQSRRKRRHQLCHHPAGAHQPEAPGHAGRPHRQRQPAVRALRERHWPAPGCNAWRRRCPTPCSTPARRSTAWRRSRPACWPMWMSIWMMVALTAILIPLPFLMRRPKKNAPAAVGH